VSAEVLKIDGWRTFKVTDTFVGAVVFAAGLVVPFYAEPEAGCALHLT
jgi:hypothetical protein